MGALPYEPSYSLLRQGASLQRASQPSKAHSKGPPQCCRMPSASLPSGTRLSSHGSHTPLFTQSTKARTHQGSPINSRAYYQEVQVSAAGPGRLFLIWFIHSLTPGLTTRRRRWRRRGRGGTCTVPRQASRMSRILSLVACQREAGSSPPAPCCPASSVTSSLPPSHSWGPRRKPPGPAAAAAAVAPAPPAAAETSLPSAPAQAGRPPHVGKPGTLWAAHRGRSTRAVQRVLPLLHPGIHAARRKQHAPRAAGYLTLAPCQTQALAPVAPPGPGFARPPAAPPTTPRPAAHRPPPPPLLRAGQQGLRRWGLQVPMTLSHRHMQGPARSRTPSQAPKPTLGNHVPALRKAVFHRCEPGLPRAPLYPCARARLRR